MADGEAPYLDEAVDEWLAEEFERSPLGASELGFSSFDDRLGDFSAAAFQAQRGRTAVWSERFSAFQASQDGGAPLDDRIDVASVLAELAGRRAMEDWYEWRREPAVYLNPCLNGVFSLFLQRLRPEAELVAAAVSRLRQVPAVLADGRANLDPDLAPRLLLERGLGMCRAGEPYLRDMLPAEVEDPALRTQLAEAGGEAASALASFAEHLAALAGGARGEWLLGEDRYSAVLEQREMLGYGCGELHRRGEEAWSELDAEMKALAHRIDPEAASWQEVIAALSREHPRDPQDMLAAYNAETRSARQFLLDRGLVTLPEGERCEVVPSPVFQRPVLAVASYEAPPPLAESSTGHFFVPYPPDGTSPEALEQRLQDNGRFTIPTVTVHEAYPGHHWQLTWAGRTPRAVRHWVSTSYFIEGWALYAEQMMREEGYFTDPRQELCHLAMRIFRAVRIIVDTGLHSGDMTADQAVDQLVRRAAMTRTVAQAEVSRYCAWPTQAASYLTGSLEIERIRGRWRAGPGAGQALRQFHDTIAASPGLPLALAEMAVMGG